MEKKDLLDRIEAARKDVEESGVTDILIATQSSDGVGYYCSSNPVVALGLARVIQIKVKKDFQRAIKGNQMHQMLQDFLDDSDDD